jgi:hypothetical protein
LVCLTFTISFLYCESNNHVDSTYYYAKIAKSLSISPSVVLRYVARAVKMGIGSWPLADTWDDVALKNTFLETKAPLKKHYLPKYC